MSERQTIARKPWAGRSSPAAPSVSSPFAPTVRAGTASGGQALDKHSSAEMSARFGHDFSRVRIHTDCRAEDSAGALGANAFAVGGDIVFGAGKYVPGSPDTERLLAHELTHVAQQAQWGGGEWGRASAKDDASEREADTLAAQVMRGQSVRALAPPQAAVARDEGDTCQEIGPPEDPGACYGPVGAEGTASARGEGQVETPSTLGQVGMWGLKTGLAGAAKRLFGTAGIPFVNPMSAPFNASDCRNHPAEQHEREDRERKEAFDAGEVQIQREMGEDLAKERDKTNMEAVKAHSLKYLSPDRTPDDAPLPGAGAQDDAPHGSEFIGPPAPLIGPPAPDENDCH